MIKIAFALAIGFLSLTASTHAQTIVLDDFSAPFLGSHLSQPGESRAAFPPGTDGGSIVVLEPVAVDRGLFAPAGSLSVAGGELAISSLVGFVEIDWDTNDFSFDGKEVIWRGVTNNTGQEATLLIEPFQTFNGTDSVFGRGGRSFTLSAGETRQLLFDNLSGTSDFTGFRIVNQTATPFSGSVESIVVTLPGDGNQTIVLDDFSAPFFGSHFSQPGESRAAFPPGTDGGSIVALEPVAVDRGLFAPAGSLSVAGGELAISSLVGFVEIDWDTNDFSFDGKEVIWRGVTNNTGQEATLLIEPFQTFSGTDSVFGRGGRSFSLSAGETRQLLFDNLSGTSDFTGFRIVNQSATPFSGTVDSIVVVPEPEFSRGDVSRDGVVDFSDIPSFIDVLVAGDFISEADTDLDGMVTFSDIPPFIAILISQ